MKVVSFKSLPQRLPIVSSLVAWLLLDSLQPSQWVWGAVGVMFALLWVGCIAVVYEQKEIDLFPE